MTYDVELSDKAYRQLMKLDKTVQERIIASLERVRIRPEDFVTKLVGDPGFKLRVGDYRIVMEIDQKVKRMMVLIIGHRKNVYKQ
jgi:mRNA interferase RelE/StbE